MPMSRNDEVASRYRTTPGVVFLSQEQCAAELALAGMKHVPPSYAWAKRVFGNSRLDPVDARFWINVASTEAHRFSLIKTRQMLLDRVSDFKQPDGSYKFPWGSEDDPASAAAFNQLDFSRLLPLCVNGESDLWHVWDLGRISSQGEPKIVIFDLGMQSVHTTLSDLCELYDLQAQWDGDIVDYEKDTDGKILLVPW